MLLLNVSTHICEVLHFYFFSLVNLILLVGQQKRHPACNGFSNDYCQTEICLSLPKIGQLKENRKMILAVFFSIAYCFIVTFAYYRNM